MQNNVNVRMGMPGVANSQPRMVRPVLNLNYMPNNNNNPHGLGYRYVAPGISFRNRAPMYQPVYQHHTEDYQQPYMNEEFSNYFGIQNSMQELNSQTWTESDYFQYLNERAAQSQMISQNNYPPQFAQVDHTARFLQRTAATAPQVVRQPKVAASQKRLGNANTSFNAGSITSQQSQKNLKNNGFAKVPRRQNQPMALLPAPKPANHRTDKPVQKKPHTIPLKQQQQKFQSETKGKPNQMQTNKTQLTQQSQVEVIKKEFAYKGKVERDRALVGTIPKLVKWRSARHKIPPVYGTVGIIDGRSNVVDEKLKIEDQFVLCNLKQWNSNAEPLVKELMECVVYTSEHRQPIFSFFCRVVGRFIPDNGLFQVLKIRLADESDLNYLSCVVNSQAFKPDKSLDRSLSAPSTFDASHEEEPVNSTNDSDPDLPTTPAPTADTDYLFQPY